jgi:murein L,D-transpeptidase YcbB/YkuD
MVRKRADQYTMWLLRGITVAIVCFSTNPVFAAGESLATTENGPTNEDWQTQALNRLSSGIARYQAIAANGGWPQVPPGPKLEPGMVDARTGSLRRRLEVTGEIAPAETESSVYDPALEAAVRAFQQRHGLLVDGVVGPNTIAALNVPVEIRLRTLRLNQSRIQAFKPWGPSYVLVNVPAFEASAIRGASKVFETRVVVGQPTWPTPQIDGMITRVEVNPYWTVPRSIKIKETIPMVRRDPGYLQRQGIRVFNGWGEGAREMDPASVDWNGLEARHYRLRQDPGDNNALGRLKFMFNNNHSVYLHDTPAKKLFQRSARALSHGCVRVQDPFELAMLLLDGQPQWDAPAVEKAIASQRNRGITLLRPMPIHLVYWTAWVDEGGRVQFRPDIYGRDLNLLHHPQSQPVQPQPPGAVSEQST